MIQIFYYMTLELSLKNNQLLVGIKTILAILALVNHNRR